MVKVLVLTVVLALIACKGVEQIKEQSALLENMKTEISELKDSVADLSAQLDSLKTRYETHLTKYHGGKKAPGPAPKPPVKMK
ncbi:MAG TPA: hypothetical protein EYP58_05520 [bacterium (Candidatus Stahlbacteria)]|nr:hypothetical protein [Candidatus Stahlbacteria bacterium]